MFPELLFQDLRQTHFKSSVWLFLNYLLFVWEASPLMQLEEVQK